AADFYVPTIPGLDAKEALQLNMHAGLIPVDLAMNASTFFWTIEARVPQPRRKLLFWFNGGPGCSSMDGVFLENGPFHVTPESKVVMKKFSWIQAATVVFVDQPLGTGYSTYDQTPGTFGAPAKTLEQVTSYLRTFMNGFYTVFPHLLNSDVYFGGESYAGVYIPYFATSITSSGSNWPPMSMKGLIIGNGWMDPLHQYPAFIEYGQDNNLIGGTYLESAKASWVACEEAYKALNTVPIKLNVCEKILETILQYSTKDGGTCINMYDIRVYDDTVEGGCGLFEWPTGLQDMKKYLGRADLKTAVHVPNNGVDMTWTECSPVVGAALSSDKSEAPYKLLPALLEKIPVLLFQGDKDLICNWYGLRDMVDNLTWNGAKGFGDAKKEKWILNGTEAGWYKSARGLTFGLIYNASHMAPFGSPLETMDMFNRFIGAKYLADDMIVGTVVRV
ncbi:Alpha/Beta hydrolase protein, partial [Zopfochytrium polystomum]